MKSKDGYVVKRWTDDEVVKMESLIKEGRKPVDLANYFPKRSRSSIRGMYWRLAKQMQNG